MKRNAMMKHLYKNNGSTPSTVFAKNSIIGIRLSSRYAFWFVDMTSKKLNQSKTISCNFLVRKTDFSNKGISILTTLKNAMPIILKISYGGNFVIALNSSTNLFLT